MNETDLLVGRMNEEMDAINQQLELHADATADKLQEIAKKYNADSVELHVTQDGVVSVVVDRDYKTVKSIVISNGKDRATRALKMVSR